MTYHSWLECTRGCGRQYSIYDVIYHCEDCGGLLDVEHDLQTLKHRPAEDWKALFDDRTHQRVALWQRRLGQEGVGAPSGG